jgi:hypothetical protein
MWELLWRWIMYKLTKLFDKGSVISATEVIQRFHFKTDGTVFAVETDKSVYLIEKIAG